MTVVSVLISVLVVAVVAAIIWDVLGGRKRANSRFAASVLRHVIVHTTEGYSIGGVLVGLYADGIEMRNARFIRADEYDTPLDGVQIIPWTSVAWMQELRDEPSRLGAENT